MPRAINSAGCCRIKLKTTALAERIKELRCLLSLGKIVDDASLSLDGIMHKIADIIPPAMQYREITGARINLGSSEFRSKRFKESGWKHASDIMVKGERAGAVEVCCREKRPDCVEGPFLKEERAMLGAISERVGKIIERHQSETALRQSEEMYKVLVHDSIQGMVNGWT